jgi:hypothetical protein
MKEVLKTFDMTLIPTDFSYDQTISRERKRNTEFGLKSRYLGVYVSITYTHIHMYMGINVENT